MCADVQTMDGVQFVVTRPLAFLRAAGCTLPRCADSVAALDARMHTVQLALASSLGRPPPCAVLGELGRGNRGLVLTHAVGKERDDDSFVCREKTALAYVDDGAVVFKLGRSEPVDEYDVIRAFREFVAQGGFAVLEVVRSADAGGAALYLIRVTRWGSDVVFESRPCGFSANENGGSAYVDFTPFDPERFAEALGVGGYAIR